MKDLFGLVAVLGGALLLVTSPVWLVGLAVWADYAACHARWEQVGKPSWGPIQGCMVKLKDGRFIPADAIRDVSP